MKFCFLKGGVQFIMAILLPFIHFMQNAFVELLQPSVHPYASQIYFFAFFFRSYLYFKPYIM